MKSKPPEGSAAEESAEPISEACAEGDASCPIPAEFQKQVMKLHKGANKHQLKFTQDHVNQLQDTMRQVEYAKQNKISKTPATMSDEGM